MDIAINEGISRIFFSERYSLKVKKFLISKLNSHRKEIGLLLFLLFDKFPDSLRDNYSELIYEYLRLEIPETKKKILMCFEQSEVFPSKTKLEIAMEIRNLLSNFFAFDLRGDPSERVIKRYLKYFLRNRKKFESKFKNFEAESNGIL